MALAQEAEPGDPLREWHMRLRVLEARSINRAKILTACMDTAAEVAKVSAAEAASAEASAAMEVVAAAEAAIPGRPMFSLGAREELKTRGGSLSSEGANAAVQTKRSTQIKFLRSLQ
jgi:hypothetical protein